MGTSPPPATWGTWCVSFMPGAHWRTHPRLQAPGEPHGGIKRSQYEQDDAQDSDGEGGHYPPLCMPLDISNAPSLALPDSVQPLEAPQSQPPQAEGLGVSLAQGQGPSERSPKGSSSEGGHYASFPLELHSQPLLESLLEEFHGLYPDLEFPELPALVRRALEP